jgi:hypothetical protein
MTLSRVEAHGDDVELLPRFEVHDPERSDEPIEHLRAEHRAFVVHERQNDRPPAEVLAEPDRLAGFVGELQIERDLMIQALIDPDLAEQPRPIFRRVPRFGSGPSHLRRHHRRAHDHRDEGSEDTRQQLRLDHNLPIARTVNP